MHVKKFYNNRLVVSANCVIHNASVRNLIERVLLSRLIVNVIISINSQQQRNTVTVYAVCCQMSNTMTNKVTT